MYDNQTSTIHSSDIKEQGYHNTDDVNLSLNVEAINNQIYNILIIPPNQVPGRPEFASGLYNFLHELNDVVTKSAIETTIRQLLINYVTRIEVTDVSVNLADDGLVIINISYIYQQDEHNTQIEVRI